MRRLLIPILILLILVVVVVIFLVLPRNGSPTNSSGTPGTEEAISTTSTVVLTPRQLVNVVIAVQSLPRGFRITPDSVAVRLWPKDSAPERAISDPTQVYGRIARTDIFVEEPILGSMIVDELGTDGIESLAHVGSDAAAVIPGNLVMVSIPMDRITGDAYAIQDGDHVDVIVSMLFVDIDENFQSIQPNSIAFYYVDPSGALTITNPFVGRLDTTSVGPAVIEPSERQRPRLVTQRTIQNAIVIHVGNFPPDGHFIGMTPTAAEAAAATQEAAPAAQPSSNQNSNATPVPTPTLTRPDIISLAVSPQDAVVLTYMVEAHLPVTLALRSVNNAAQTATDPVTLDYMMTQYNIQKPGLEPFALEPAIRSIRQLLVGHEITLSDVPPLPAQNLSEAVSANSAGGTSTTNQGGGG